MTAGNHSITAGLAHIRSTNHARALDDYDNYDGYDNYDDYDPSTDAITPEGPGAEWTISTPIGVGYNSSNGRQTTLRLGPLSYTYQTNQFGLSTPYGSIGFGPTRTSFSVGPSFGGWSLRTPVVSVPYGYQNVYQDIYNGAQRILGPANDYKNWMNYNDPFGHNMFGY